MSPIALLFTIVSANASWLTVGPDYKQPTNSVPANYKAVDFGTWKEGQPLDNVPKGNWWEIFGDTNLNALEAQAVQANQQLKAAVARVDQARDTARVARERIDAQLEFGSKFRATALFAQCESQLRQHHGQHVQHAAGFEL